MDRQDYGLAFLLRYENVAWYDNGCVRILDRRIYPHKTKFVECKTYIEVVEAIKNMVTQSAGPYTAVGMGMALAAYEARNLNDEDKITFLKEASYQFAHARVTTAHRYLQITTRCVEIAINALKEGQDCAEAIKEDTIVSLNRRYQTMEKVARHFIDVIPDDAYILTQCFAETILGMLCRVAKEKHKNLHFYHAETRPYLQGARLSSSVVYEMGFDSTVITDNMVAYTMANRHIDIFTSAADTIAMDGTIANKIGTYQIAILAKYFNIPYYVSGIPDYDKASSKDIIIEERDGEQILQMHGIHHTIAGVKGIYPSFDITPANLIRGIVSEHGIYEPGSLHDYLKKERTIFY